MAQKTKNKKIRKYRRHSYFNIGTMLFGTVFVYMVIALFAFFFQKHVTSYEVRKGSITGNYRYQALALRTEEIITASQSGSIRYYEREGAKTSAGSVVCSINETGSQDPVFINDFSMTIEDATRLKDTMTNFTIDFSNTNFQKTYDLKASVQGRIAEVIEANSSGYVSIRNQCIAPESGFVIYSIDGYEDITDENLTSNMFDQTKYAGKNLRMQNYVSAGEPLFKLVTDELWSLYFPVDSKLMTELTDMTSIRFRFLKDNQTFTAPFEIIKSNNDYFGKITLDNSLVRYSTERYLGIELLMNKKSGLKIPTSSIVEREFYKIPGEYVLKNEDTTKEVGIKIQRFSEDGSSNERLIVANVYDHNEKSDTYLIDKNLFQENDYIKMDNSIKTMQLKEEDLVVLHGVYNINKGYCVFREITVIDENEEYCIVEANNIYGLAAYDYIVLDAAQVTEDEIVY